MYAEETHFRKLFLKQFEIVLEYSTLVTFDPVTPKSIGFLPYPGWMCGPGIRKVGHVVLQLVIGTVLAHLTTLTFDPVTQNIKRVHLLPRMDVRTMFEEGRSRHSPFIDRKWFWHI